MSEKPRKRRFKIYFINKETMIVEMTETYTTAKKVTQDRLEEMVFEELMKDDYKGFKAWEVL